LRGVASSQFCSTTLLLILAQRFYEIKNSTSNKDISDPQKVLIELTPFYGRNKFTHIITLGYTDVFD